MQSVTNSKDTTDTKAKENTCPDSKCQMIIDQILAQTGVVRRRYYLMLLDEHNLATKAKKTPHPDGHGSWKGHQDKYEAERKTLNGLIMEAWFAGCSNYVPQESRRWAETKAPKKPNPTEANNNNFFVR